MGWNYLSILKLQRLHRWSMCRCEYERTQPSRLYNVYSHCLSRTQWYRRRLATHVVKLEIKTNRQTKQSNKNKTKTSGTINKAQINNMILTSYRYQFYINAQRANMTLSHSHAVPWYYVTYLISDTQACKLQYLRYQTDVNFNETKIAGISIRYLFIVKWLPIACQS